ncbi:MAG: Hsp33 family molecular chaperone HslO [Blastocatellia bacterium]|nr:Hsp33 family molecular chaperone HslO [Blastocatellia bacterium]
MMERSKDLLVRATACDGMVRCVAAITTNLVDEASRRHRTSPTVSAALGRTLTAGALLGSMLKDTEKVTLLLQCTGPIGSITVEADAHGNVRGYAKNPQVDLPLNEKKKFDVRGIIGGGMLYVLREADYYRTGLFCDPYCGSVPIVSGEIAEDVAYYLTQSEQIPSAVSLGVFVLPDAERFFRVEAAGGFLIQTFPGTSDDVLRELEASVLAAPYVTEMIRRGMGPREILQTALGQYAFEILEEKEIRFACTCSLERARRILAALDPKELRAMLQEDGGAEMVCHFCNATYCFDATELRALLPTGDPTP